MASPFNISDSSFASILLTRAFDKTIACQDFSQVIAWVPHPTHRHEVKNGCVAGKKDAEARKRDARCHVESLHALACWSHLVSAEARTSPSASSGRKAGMQQLPCPWHGQGTQAPEQAARAKRRLRRSLV